jgi:hypothetical protein
MLPSQRFAAPGAEGVASSVALPNTQISKVSSVVPERLPESWADMRMQYPCLR